MGKKRWGNLFEYGVDFLSRLRKSRFVIDSEIEPFIDCLVRFQIMKGIINWFMNVSGKEHRERFP